MDELVHGVPVVGAVEGELVEEVKGQTEHGRRTGRETTAAVARRRGAEAA